MNNQPAQRPTFSVYINSRAGQNLLSKALPSPQKRQEFVTSLVSAVSANPALQECTPESIISAALQGTALSLVPSPQLGLYYMVPFKDKKRGVTTATFVLGYKGMVQLALRSGQYLDLDAMPVKEGEYLGRDETTGRPLFSFIANDEIREQSPTIGYMAYFELLNGAKKVIYWSREKMINHADKYSAAFSKEATSGKYPKVSYEQYLAGNYPQRDQWLYSSHWYSDFDGMACKTMLRQLISKWGPMSIEMANAITNDINTEEAHVDFMPVGLDQDEIASPPQEMLPDPSERPMDLMESTPEKAPEPITGSTSSKPQMSLDDI